MTNEDEELLADLLLRWEDLHERGQDTPASELAHDRPDLVAELDHRIAALRHTAWLDEPIDDIPPDDAPAPAAPRSPRTLAGRYRLDELIAEGGFARVYRGYDTQLQRTVAVKLPKPGCLGSTTSLQAEARRVARLKHEHIVPVHDVGLEGDTCFIVTDYVEGGSLADRLVNGAVSPAEAIRWAMDIADALEYAHLNGVVHLDVKPANILIGANGRARLADFGIAKSATKTGEFAPSLGTLRSMSPEQLQGRPTDHRSDIYSLAVVLHEALTGSLPYSSPEANVLRREIAQGIASPARKLPAGLRRVLAKAMASSPHQRHASAMQFAAEIRRARSPGWPWSPWPARIGLALFIPGLVLAARQWAGTGGEAPAAPPIRELMAISTTNMHSEQFARAEAGFTKALEIAPDNLEALTKRGLCRLGMERFEGAVDDFDAALAVRPDDATALRYRARAHGLLRDFPRAIEDLERVMVLSPDADEVRGDLATIYAIRSHERFQEGDYRGAKDDMDATIRYAPESAVNYGRRAACWFQMGDYQQAVDDLTAAIRRQPATAEFFGKRSLALLKLGRHEEAAADERHAEELRR